MRIYLDNCCFNRPFDEQTQEQIYEETQAVLKIQEQIEKENFDLIWSYILDYENSLNPFENRKNEIFLWKSKSILEVEENNNILNIAESLAELNLKIKDALHIACALDSKCCYFLSTDKRLLNKNSFIENIEMLNPIDFINHFNI